MDFLIWNSLSEKELAVVNDIYHNEPFVHDGEFALDKLEFIGKLVSCGLIELFDMKDGKKIQIKFNERGIREYERDRGIRDLEKRLARRESIAKYTSASASSAKKL